MADGNEQPLHIQSSVVQDTGAYGAPETNGTDRANGIEFGTSVVNSPVGLNGVNGTVHPESHSNADPQPHATSTVPDEDMFWRQPVSSLDKEIRWFHTPIPIHQHRRAEVEGLVDRLAGMMKDSPYRAWLLQWTFHTRSASAQEEKERVERETQRLLAEQAKRAEETIGPIEKDIEKLEASEKALEAIVEQKQGEYAKAAARAGLALEPGEVQPHRVEAALRSSVPNLDALAGRYGVHPLPVEKGGFHVGLTGVLEAFARLVSGFMLALCLGTLVGLVNMENLQRKSLTFTDFFPFYVSAGLGFVIVSLMGELFYRAVAGLRQTLEERDADSPAVSATSSSSASSLTAVPHPPRNRYALPFACIFLGFACLLGVSEVVAEATGLETLHADRIKAQKVFGDTDEHTLPWGIYALVGLLISGPYLLYKTTKAWHQGDAEQRRAWLLAKQNEWLAVRRQESEVQDVFDQAGGLEKIEARLEKVKDELEEKRRKRSQLKAVALSPEMEKRLDDARAAAVGEAARLHFMAEQLVDLREPMHAAPPETPRPPARARAAGTSLR